jgi:Ca2+ transporting ATPase
LTGRSYTGREFDEMTKKEQIEAVHRANVFSRTEPTHKQQLVELLTQEGFVVAMVCRSLVFREY